MKKALLIFAGLLVTVFSFAAVAPEDDPKYGKGAIPVDENGSVYFERVLPVPQGMTDDQCYEILIKWSKGHFVSPYVHASRVLNEDAASRRFIFHMDQIIVFKRTDLVLDQSNVEYNYSVAVKNGQITLRITDIKYRYEEHREGGGQRFTAEEWITDKEAYNRKGTKFLKSTGKFRIKTIDMKDKLFLETIDALIENL